MSLESDLKELYEKELMRIILDAYHTGNSDSDFIKTEIRDKSRVWQIKLSLVDTPYRDHYGIFTETEDVGYFAVSNSDDVVKMCEEIIEEYGQDAYIDEGIREWYDEYLVPKLERCFTSLEI